MPAARQRTIVRWAAALLILAVAQLPGRLSAEEGVVQGGVQGVTVTVPPPAPSPAAKQKAPKSTAAASPPEAPASGHAEANDTNKSDAKTAHAKGANQSIAVLVNDEPITDYEIEQRVRLGSSGELQQRLKARLSSPNTNDEFKAFAIKRLKENPPKSEEEQKARIKELQSQFVEGIKQQLASAIRPQARKEAIEELIDEHLKLQEAKRLNAVTADEDVDKIIAGIAERNKMTVAQFSEHMKSTGADVSTLRNRFKAETSWREVIRSRFGRQVAITEHDVDRLVATAPSGEDEVELQVQRVTLPIPVKSEQKLIAQRIAEADGIAGKFAGCTSTSVLAAGVPGAKFEDLGTRKPSSIPEPTRSLLLSAGDGAMLPASVGPGGVELWALCGRKVLKADDQKREVAQNELRQKEFEILAKKHLKDLRQDAAIEYR